MLEPCTKVEFERVIARAAVLEPFKYRISDAHGYVQISLKRGNTIVAYGIECGDLERHLVDPSLVSPEMRN